MTSGFHLHLTGPLQSYGGPQGGRVRDTRPHPTRSALTGMIAAAQGRARGTDLTDLDALTYTIRVDRPGERLRDWHTIGGGYPKHQTVMTANGNRRGDALTYEDYFLTDAAFTVAVTGPTQLIDQAAAALARPVFPPHLGRRACPPALPVLIATSTDPITDLDRLPLHREQPHKDQPTVDILFIAEHPPADEPHRPPTRHINDAPLPGRRYASRPVWETQRPLPAALCTGFGTPYLTALTAATRTTP
ncbi:type I-E CRISPR-associated protein Cas5/CasD [Streptomyces sp. NRRL F-5702]|uniref:type I-E CRISPR-associated protein Cas5/CasD n=1 Tax=Streptomyces sp. NRRL F-5702 TaxID=1463870 RepID=UPI0004CBEA2B|nr:type I-E CRISPR-associated protein Cas5/CasD [Streptomyces sp. NRRL F-5702]